MFCSAQINVEMYCQIMLIVCNLFEECGIGTCNKRVNIFVPYLHKSTFEAERSRCLCSVQNVLFLYCV